jgi:hypothetical protein
MVNVLNAKDIAAQFLDLWAEEHSDNDQPNYQLLRDKFVAIGDMAINASEVDAVRDELRKQRRERGWPDPKPPSPGKMSIEPTIEGAIIALWRWGMQQDTEALAKRQEARIRRLAIDMGFRVLKSRERTQHDNNRGAYMLVDDHNVVVTGSRFDASLDEILDYLGEAAS